MTLCIVWRTPENIHFASDSRLSFGSATADAGIKVCRVPYNIYGPTEEDRDEIVADGDLGMTFAGSATVAMMMKEALCEIVRDLQAVPGYHDDSMDGIADVIKRGFKVVAHSISGVLYENAATYVVFAGWCKEKKALRAYRLMLDQNNHVSLQEVLLAPGDVEIFGSGKSAAQAIIPLNPSSKQIVGTIQKVIDDPAVESVGGSLQYGYFSDKRFKPLGIARMDETTGNANYWRGPLDLNSEQFDQVGGLIPRFQYIDDIR